jgi:HAD superfamily hydrolase (TIGR01450 family)
VANPTPIEWDSIDVVVADLDGTLYLGESALPGALEFVRDCMRQKPLYFLSNNTSKTPDDTYHKLVRLGFDVLPNQVLSPLHGLILAMQNSGYSDFWVMANPPVLSWLQERLPAFNLRADRNVCQAVVVAYDDSLTYKDLCEVGWRLQDGCAYWITHPDFVCPNPAGPVPDVGGLIELFAIGFGRRPERLFGKPSPEVLSPLWGRFSASRLLFLGDRLYTDWELSRQAGCQFRLSLAGETTLEMWEAIEGEKPLLF